MNYPHLKDTSFPDLKTADVYQFQNTFDYTRWTQDTKVKLVNVIWNSDYSDVVKFDTNDDRDRYFNTIEDFYAIELTQAARIVPQNFVKLPIPYDVMARYNYLFIDMPIATSEDAPIDYETGYGIRRWFFFVDDIAYQSPNTTQVFLSLDVWTNFQNEIEINYMMLERGHAPVAYSDTEEYLENPVENNRYLLAPDVNFDNASITRSSDYIPFGNGRKYVCFASTCAPEQISSLGTVYADSSYDPTGTITYSDVQTRYGHQLQVNGLSIGNGRNYSNARTMAKAGASNDNLIANNTSVYAIEAVECYGNGTFFTDVMQKCPQFLKMYELDSLIRNSNKYWVKNINEADSKGDIQLKRQTIIDVLHMAKVAMVLLHPVVPKSVENLAEFLKVDKSIFSWDNIDAPIYEFVENPSDYKPNELQPKQDFFKKHPSQLEE